MANTHNTLSSLFSSIAAAIRQKTGGTDNIVADDFPTEIRNIQIIGENIGRYKLVGGVLTLNFTEDQMINLVGLVVKFEYGASYLMAIHDIQGGDDSGNWIGQVSTSSMCDISNNCITIDINYPSYSLKWAIDAASVLSDYCEVYAMYL